MIRAIETAQLLVCPLCDLPLTQNTQQGGKQFRCENNHCFDIARQGYINLLPVQQKRSKSPGDDKQMVLARQRFLNAGFYQPLATALNQLLADTVADSDTTLLDAGCGEGYYSQFLLNHNSTGKINIYGIDISKPAILEACKRTKAIHWLVASLKNIPLADHSLDAIVSVFSPIQSDTFLRKLHANGVLAVVSPGKQHLHSLKALLYDQVESFNEEKILSQLQKNWQLIQQEKLCFNFELSSNEMLQDLLSMTPHSWRISPERKARLQQVNALSCEADFVLTLWRKNHE